MERTTYKNNYNREKYDRINLVLPKGQKSLLQGICDEMGISINDYIKTLIREDLRGGQSKLQSLMTGFREEHNETLNKWQIASKYRSMIQDFSMSKEDGYFIRLKKGYINDVTGTRIIHVDKMQEVRKLITKSHKV